MKLTEKLNDEPRIFHSGKLSRIAKHGIKVDVMYYPNTHKLKKARHGLDYVEDKKGDYALIITSGNAGPAFDDVARDENYNIQVVNFVNKDRAKRLISVKKIGGDIEGRKRHNITIRLPNGFSGSKWLGTKELEKFWKYLIQGKWKYRAYRKDKGVGVLKEFLHKLEENRN